jgi:hypothetical protein
MLIMQHDGYLRADKAFVLRIPEQVLWLFSNKFLIHTQAINRYITIVTAL